jgi:hypothetical protein
MPTPDPPEVQRPFYALAWIDETYRGRSLVMHDGAIDGFTVHLGFVPATGQGLIVLMNRDDATPALNAVAYSAYDRLLGLEPLDWERRLREVPTPRAHVRSVALDFPIEDVLGEYEHPAYGPITVRADGSQLAMQFRTLRATLVYQGGRRFLSEEPMVDGGPNVAVRFSKPARGERLQLIVPLNLDAGDPVEVFTRVRSWSLAQAAR